MRFKEILVHVNSTVASTSRVWLSLAIPRRCGSRVIGLHAIQNPDVPQYFKPSEAERVANLYMESAREAATMAESQFRRDVKDAGVETEWRSADGDVARGLAEHGRFADLIVVGQDDTENPSIIEPFLLPQKVVMASGMPVLVIPVGPTQPNFGQRILVAWDGSREAARAVHDSLPLFQQASQLWAAHPRCLGWQPRGSSCRSSLAPFAPAGM